MQDAVNFSVLGEKVQLDSCKLCVIGNEMAGKTTSVNSLLDLNHPPIDPDDRTAGVVVRTDDILGVGKGSIWDFGAQPAFHSAHGLFFGPSNTIFVLVLCYYKDGKIVPKRFSFDGAYIGSGLPRPHDVQLYQTKKLVLTSSFSETSSGREMTTLKRVSS